MAQQVFDPGNRLPPADDPYAAFSDKGTPDPYAAFSDPPIPTRTTEDMGLLERLKELTRTAGQEVWAGLAGTPRAIANAKAGGEQMRGTYTSGERTKMIQAGMDPDTPENAAKIKAKVDAMIASDPEHPFLGETVKRVADENLPTADEELRRVVGNTQKDIPDYALTYPTEGSGRVFQAGARGAFAAIPALATGQPELVLGTGIGAPVAGQVAREAGAPESVATGVELATGLIPGPGGMLRRAIRPGATEVLAGATRRYTEGELAAAAARMRDRATLGIPTLADEELAAVTGQSGPMTNVRRVVSTTAEGAPGEESAVSIMRRRPEDVARTTSEQLRQIEPTMRPEDVSQVGPRLQQTMRGSMQAVTGGRSMTVRPIYSAPGRSVAQMSDTDLNALRDALANNPAIAQAWGTAQRLARSGGEPLHEWWTVTPEGIHIENLPTPQAAKSIDYELGQVVKGGYNPATGVSTPEARAAARAQAQFRQILDPYIPELQQGDDLFRRITQQTVTPLQNEAPGKLAKATPTMAAQRPILAPKGEQMELREPELQLTRQMAGTQPGGETALDRWQRADLESRFAEAQRGFKTKPVAEGAGAGFWSDVAGNPQQMANLMARLPEQARPGMQRLLETLRTTGFAPVQGSMTSFNDMIKENLAAGSPIGQLTTAPIKPLQALRDRINRMRYSGNVEQINRDLARPEVLEQLAQLRGMSPYSPNAQRLAAAILGSLGGETQLQQ